MTAGVAAYHSGAGIIGELLVGFAAEAVALVALQVAFGAVKSPVLRSAIAIFFATPAAIAGYQASLVLAHIGVPSATWRVVFAVVGSGMRTESQANRTAWEQNFGMGRRLNFGMKATSHPAE